MGLMRYHHAVSEPNFPDQRKVTDDSLPSFRSVLICGASVLVPKFQAFGRMLLNVLSRFYTFLNFGAQSSAPRCAVVEQLLYIQSIPFSDIRGYKLCKASSIVSL